MIEWTLRVDLRLGICMTQNMPAREARGRRKRTVIYVLGIHWNPVNLYAICGHHHLELCAKNSQYPSDAPSCWGRMGREAIPCFQGRIDHALWLYNRQYVDKLIFTGDAVRRMNLPNRKLPGSMSSSTVFQRVTSLSSRLRRSRSRICTLPIR